MRRRILLGGEDKYEAVDLGIISGGKKLLWAKWNIGATSETDCGNYYMYGKGSKKYNKSDSAYTGTENPLASSADTATQVWGDQWRTPTKAECTAFTANTTYTWTTINGVNGAKFTSKVDSSKYVFLPAGGYWDNGSQLYFGSYGHYWSSTPGNSRNAIDLTIDSGSNRFNSNDRLYGFCIRGVKEVPLDDSDTNGHAYVDLGLPSGTLWATMNVGATSETEYGNYYKYGLGASQYDNSQADYTSTENPLASSADTATQVWGGLWHMPTYSQLNELTANTTYTWTTINGVGGYKFISKTDTSKYIFLPAAGYWQNGSQSKVGTNGYYWSSTPNDSYSYYMYFFNGNEHISNYGARRSGYSVRPVIGIK